MEISSEGVAALMKREGRRLNAYQDERGIWTIGVGHTAAAGLPHPAAGMTIAADECAAIFKADLGPYGAAVSHAIRVPVSQPEFDAMVSICFNIGVNGFAGSSIVHRLNTGDVNGAADAFLMWESPPDLAGRRRGERAQFLSGGMSPRAAVPAPPVGSTRWLQASLNRLGANPRLAIDGDYGPEGSRTRAAVAAFQGSHGLFVDGVAGENTIAAISAALGG